MPPLAPLRVPSIGRGAPESAREFFRALLHVRAWLAHLRAQETEAQQVAMQVAIEAACRAHAPTVRHLKKPGDAVAWARKLGLDVGPIEAPFRAAHDLDWKSYQSDLDVLDARLRKAAGPAKLLRGPMREVTCTHVVSYGSQGYGARRYAEGAAEMRADGFRVAGYEVRTTFVHPGTPMPANGGPFPAVDCRGHYLVEADVKEDLDVEIVHRRSPPTLREVVRMCWKRGVNPRVYNPFLPWDYEKQEGLDQFGNDLRAVRGVP